MTLGQFAVYKNRPCVSLRLRGGSWPSAWFRHPAFMESKELALACARLADNKKAENITLLDLREPSSVADYFVIVTGANEPHLRAIVDEIIENLKEKHNIRPFSTEGARATPWVVLDYFDVLVHVMNDEFRKHYDLEGLWGDAQRVPFEPESSPVAAQA